MATGYQMIAQSSSSSKVHVNQSMDLQAPVTVAVESGVYYVVTIFPMREGTGIVLVGANVGYTRHVLVVGDVTSYATDLDSTGIYLKVTLLQQEMYYLQLQILLVFCSLPHLLPTHLMWPTLQK